MLRRFTPWRRVYVSEPVIPFYVVGALVTVYIVAATWRSKDVAERLGVGRRPVKARAPTLDRRLVHWWRARRRVSSLGD
jgi:hypothetical protein